MKLRVRFFLFVGVCGLSAAVACSFPDVTYSNDAGADGTVLDGATGDAPNGDAPAGDAPPGDGGPGGADCGQFGKSCATQCVSAFDPDHGCARPTCDPCPGPAHGTAICAPDGGCGEVCDTPWADCDKNPANGCESNPKSGDPNHCGDCITKCGGTDVCNLGDGGCAAGCEAGTKCGSSCVDEKVDPNHCGDCITVCTAGNNATPMCNDGGCGYACVAPWADCDGQKNTGCEKNLKGDPDTCGDCKNTCKAGQNAAAACVDGGCAFGCQTGFFDCNGDVGSGGACECTGACKGATCKQASDCCSGQCLTLDVLPVQCAVNLACACK